MEAEFNPTPDPIKEPERFAAVASIRAFHAMQDADPHFWTRPLDTFELERWAALEDPRR